MGRVLLLLSSSKDFGTPPFVRIVDMAALRGEMRKELSVAANGLSLFPRSIKVASVILYLAPLRMPLQLLLLRQRPQKRATRILDKGEPQPV